ncbi:MAG: hypothetical protein SCI25_03475 [Desulfuromonadales bacterium]|nr:hypothetical protein [Desulfuromonadales bacterium]MDW7757287.1 hypothetical protein [Desulfuromonadales bacterium]
MEKRVTVRLNQVDFDLLEKEANKSGSTLADALRQGWRQGVEGINFDSRLAGLETRTADRIGNIETLLTERLTVLAEMMKLLAEGQDKIVRQSNTLALEIAKKRPAQPTQPAQQRPTSR